MYHVRIPRDSGWKGCKLSIEEVQKLQKAAFAQRIKLLSALKNLIKEAKVELTETETLAVFHGVAPTFADLAVDYCTDQLNAKAAEAKTPAAAS